MNNKFVRIHENEIKYYRDNYYQNLTLKNNKYRHTFPVLTFLIPLIISQLILIHYKFSISAYIISIALLVTINILICFLFTLRVTKNKYLEAIQKYGYRNIEEYEKKVKKNITGPEGYYHNILLDYIEKYNINSSTKRITTTKNEEYYIWTKKNKLYMLSTHSYKKPEIIAIPKENIRYYRIDETNQRVVLKTKENIFTFKEKYSNILDELLKEKNIENNQNIEPTTHINDYELYMHKNKKRINDRLKYHKEKLEKNIYKTAYYIATIVILIILTLIIPRISNITNTINCLIIILLNISINKILKHITPKKIDLNRLILTNPEITTSFEELKHCLGVKKGYSSIYSIDNNEYIIWTSNKYIHLFQNTINYNCFYISVKKTDVKLLESTSTCPVKFKNKKIEFKISTKKVINKLLRSETNN